MTKQIKTQSNLQTYFKLPVTKSLSDGEIDLMSLLLTHIAI